MEPFTTRLAKVRRWDMTISHAIIALIQVQVSRFGITPDGGIVDELEDRLVVEDPIAFTKPWQVVRTYDLKPDWEIKEYVCEENNRNPINPDGSTGFIAPK